MEGVLPDADDFPAPAPEWAGDALVAGDVVFAFAVTELPVCYRVGVTVREDY